MNLIKRFIELTDPDWVEKHIINLYRLEGTGREYAAPIEPEVPLGVENIFGTVR